MNDSINAMQEIPIGKLSFRIEHRTTGDDQGPAIRVFGVVDNQDTQLLRFDCFESDPHYHYDPTGENMLFHLDPLTMGDPIEFSLSQISSNVKAMIEKAGFTEVANTVDQSEIATNIDQIRKAVLSGNGK